MWTRFDQNLTGRNKCNGESKNNKMNGHGIFTWVNDKRYEGEFKDDKSHHAQLVCR